MILVACFAVDCEIAKANLKGGETPLAEGKGGETPARELIVKTFLEEAVMPYADADFKELFQNGAHVIQVGEGHEGPPELLKVDADGILLTAVFTTEDKVVDYWAEHEEIALTTPWKMWPMRQDTFLLCLREIGLHGPSEVVLDPDGITGKGEVVSCDLILESFGICCLYGLMKILNVGEIMGNLSFHSWFIARDEY